MYADGLHADGRSDGPGPEATEPAAHGPTDVQAPE